MNIKTKLFFASMLLITHAITFADSYIPVPSWYEPSQVPGVLWTIHALTPAAHAYTSPQAVNIDNLKPPINNSSIWVKSKKTVISRPIVIQRIKLRANANFRPISQPFNAIRTQGTINYQITVGGRGNAIEVLGNPAAVPTIQYNVYNGVLELTYHSKIDEVNNPPLLVILHAAQLNRINQNGSGSINVRYLNRQMLQVKKAGSGNLTVNGNVQLVLLKADGAGDIIFNNIKTNNLFMDVNTSGIVRLNGQVSLAQLYFSGAGNLQMRWIKSGNLTVKTAGSSTVSLAGTAKIINAYAYNNSHLNLRFLRTETMFVKSYNNASVDVWAQNNLFSLARNNSNIYYYTEPYYKTRMMQESGTVLPMADIPSAIVTFNTH